MQEKVPSNIRWLYLITFLGECYLTMAIWLFFYSRYLTFSEITTLVILQQLVQLIFEIPTGAISDLLGKRKTLMASYFLYFISLVLTPFFSTFWVFFALEFFKGIAKSLSSGTFEALTYDSLKEHHQEESYPKVTAHLTSLSWIAYIIAGALGGILFDISFYLPYLLLASFYLIAFFIIVAKIKEPAIDTEKGSFSFTKYARQTLMGFKELFSTRGKGALVVFLLLGTLGYYTASEYLGVSQGKTYGLSATMVSLLFTGGYLISALLAQFFSRLLKKHSALTLAMTSSLIMLLSFVLALFVNPVIGMGLIMARISSSSTFGNARSVLINKEITSANRATALSTFSLLYTLPYVFIAYLGGQYIDSTSVNSFALVLGIILSISVVLSIGAYFSTKEQLTIGESRT